MTLFKRKKFEPSPDHASSIPEGLWMKCSACHGTVYRSEVEKNLQVCPACSHHYRIGAWERIRQITDPDTFEELFPGLESADPLEFRVENEAYTDRLARAKEQTGLSEALLTGVCAIEGVRTALGVMDSAFIMASMGSALGERFCRIARYAIEQQIPFLMFAASGGARMQEGTVALMQMAKTADAVRRMNEAGIPFVVVLTDPTSGGVFASFASLGDVAIAEPKAYIGFAGTRLIQGALNVKIPEGFQRAEYQFENGFLDDIVKRVDLRAYLGRILKYLSPQHRNAMAEAISDPV